MVLIRQKKRADGIFSLLMTDQGEVFAWTLEHAYRLGWEFAPKIPASTFLCVRGIHRLACMVKGFETFEVTGVVGHSSLLFHTGNYNCDSEGCILLGQNMVKMPNGLYMIAQSKNKFEEFMKVQADCRSFRLTVVDNG